VRSIVAKNLNLDVSKLAKEVKFDDPLYEEYENVKKKL